MVFKQLSELKVGDIILCSKTQTIGKCTKPYCYYSEQNEFYEQQRNKNILLTKFVKDTRENRWGWDHFIGKEINILTGEETGAAFHVRSDPCDTVRTILHRNDKSCIVVRQKVTGYDVING